MTTQKIIPINVDRNVSKSDYRYFAAKEQLLVTSMFYTFQGEGPYAGWPAVFLRLAGCNIGAKDDCPFCDTKFWFDQGKTWNYEDLASELNKVGQGKAKLLVITGGEPMLQLEVMKKLINTMHEGQQMLKDWTIEYFQIESNGYFVKNDSFSDTQADVTVVISPKVAASLGKYPKPKLDWFNSNEYPGNTPHALKYVVSADPASPYHEIPQEVIFAAKEYEVPLYVSAMAVYLKSYPDGRTSSIWDTDEIDQKATADNYRYAAQYALKHGLLVSYQSHLFGGVE